ncbi:MAG: hypothetical protein L3J65_05785 [Robiginitomaculum sp.]|nr:hypothetical protein [Robiginitomaculum sp.]
MAPLSIAALKLQMSDVIRAQPLPPEMLVQSKNRAADLLKSADYKEGISALREKRHPKFKGV